MRKPVSGSRSARRFMATIRAALVAGFVLAGVGAAGADNIVLESHVGARDKTFAPLLAPVFEELGRREARMRYEDVGRKFEQTTSTPAITGAGLPADFVASVDRGYRLWLDGKFKDSIAALAPLLELAHGSPGAVVADSKAAGAVYKALVALALCHHRLGDDPAAFAAMSELLRSFEAEVSKGQYGSEAYDLYQRTKKSAREGGTGTLVVRSRDDAAAIIVNERIIKVGELERTDLVPGRYRVLAQRGKDLGRVTTVEVKAGARAEVVLDPAFERAVVTSPQWSGLSFRDRAEREQHEVELAARFGAAMGAVGVIVLGTDVRNQRLVAYGALINAATGKEIRRASVVVDTLPPPERLRSLAKFLTGDQPGEGLEVHGPGQPAADDAVAAPTGEPASVTRPRSGAWKWLATGGAVLGVGAGVGLFVLDGSCAEETPAGQVCRDVYETRPQAYLAGGVGLALGAVATWLWLSDGGERRPRRALHVVPTRGGALVGVQLVL